MGPEHAPQEFQTKGDCPPFVKRVEAPVGRLPVPDPGSFPAPLLRPLPPAWSSQYPHLSQDKKKKASKESRLLQEFKGSGDGGSKGTARPWRRRGTGEGDERKQPKAEGRGGQRCCREQCAKKKINHGQAENVKEKQGYLGVFSPFKRKIGKPEVRHYTFAWALVWGKQIFCLCERKASPVIVQYIEFNLKKNNTATVSVKHF